MEILTRILASKKFIYAMVPIVANALAILLGYDPTNTIVLVVDGFFGLLVTVQGIIDAVHGSPSDGTDTPQAATLRRQRMMFAGRRGK